MGTLVSRDAETAVVRPGEELNLARLEEYLRLRIPEKRRPRAGRTRAVIELEQFPGGHSNLTYLIRFAGSEFVLRRPPLGPIAARAHDMPREFRVLSLVHPVFNLAPKPHLLCEDPDILGAPFYLMERRRGYVIRKELPPEIKSDVLLRRRISEAVVDTLANLHAVDILTTGIEQIGKPAGFLQRQILGWAERWEQAKTSRVPEVEAIKRRLLEKVPGNPEATLVHNDYKLDNLMLDFTDPARIAAVLDWEMCTVGDPLVDLGILLSYWPERKDPEARRNFLSDVTGLPGWLSRGELVERYALRTGRDVSSIAFYEAFALFKVAIVFQQIYFRYHKGQTRDVRFSDFGKHATVLIKTAWKLAGNI